MVQKMLKHSKDFYQHDSTFMLRIIAGNKSCICLRIWAPPVEYGFDQRPEKMLIWKRVHFGSWSLFSSWKRVIKVYQVIHLFIIWNLSSFGLLILATSSTLFWGVLKDIISPASPGPTWGLLLIDHRRHPKQMPKPQLATINVVEQWLCSESPLNVQAPHISNGEPNHLSKEINFHQISATSFFWPSMNCNLIVVKGFVLSSDTRITGRVFHYKLVLDEGAKNSSMTP